MFHFYNTCLNSFNIYSPFSVAIIISLTLFEFSSITDFVFAIFSAILFPINLPLASAALWTYFLEAIFKASSPVSNNCFLYLFEKFLANNKNPYRLTYFLVLCSIEYCVISIYQQTISNLLCLLFLTVYHFHP